MRGKGTISRCVWKEHWKGPMRIHLINGNVHRSPVYTGSIKCTFSHTCQCKEGLCACGYELAAHRPNIGVWTIFWFVYRMCVGVCNSTTSHTSPSVICTWWTGQFWSAHSQDFINYIGGHIECVRVMEICLALCVR